MNIHRTLVFILAIFCFSLSGITQDANFTQWEAFPLHFNPALTGGFEGKLRVDLKYRNQWQSLLKQYSYRTRAASVEYNMGNSPKGRFAIGAYILHDIAGQLRFRTIDYKFTASYHHHFDHQINSNHEISFGLTLGALNQKIDFDNAQWPGGLPEELSTNVVKADMGVGLNWKLRTRNNFSYQVGAAIHHLNQPNVSFSDTLNEPLRVRKNLYAIVEIPLSNSIALIPTFHYMTMKSSKQSLYGVYGEWQFSKSHNAFVRLGYLLKSASTVTGNPNVARVYSAWVKWQSLLIGFSFDRYHEIKSNAYEFSLGYIIGRNNI